MKTTPQQGALSGVKVLDLTRVLSGPWCTMTLGDLGADVIKVEPETGDDTREMGPPFIGEFSAYFTHVNRNKKSIVVNMKEAAGQKIIHELAQNADVVIENFRTGVVERLNVDYATLKKINPRIIYASISGYGRTGVRAEYPGYDLIIQSQGGIMSVTGPKDGMPHKVGVAVVDITTGMNATIAILAALHAREQTGVGQYIDISLYCTQLQWLSNAAANTLFSGQDAHRWGNGNPNIVPYQLFETQDGWFTLCVGNDKQWRDLCTHVLNEPTWTTDPRFATNPARVKHRELIVSFLQAHFKMWTREELLPKITAVGVPCGNVHTVKEAINHKVTLEQGMRQEMRTSSGDMLPMMGSPLRLSDTPVRYELPPPRLGEHTTEILESLWYSKADISSLLKNGVVMKPKPSKAA